MDGGFSLVRIGSGRSQGGAGGSKFICKRMFDVSASAILLALLSPVLLAIVLAIRLTSPGPVLFKQKRYGQASRPFWIFKFRTMHVQMTDHTGVLQTQPYDDRITPVGHFLRRANLDELPQLLNVLRGDMSLVGPRPHVPGMLAGGVLYEELVPFYFERHEVRPGITGLAQACRFRGSTLDPRLAIERINYDLAYVRNSSLVLDLKILWCTLKNEVWHASGL